MHDLKSYFMAFFPSTTAILTAIDAPSSLTIVASIVLPCCFFFISKTVDVLLQIYFKRKK